MAGAVYVEGRRVAGSWTPEEAKVEAARRRGFVWIGLFEPDAIVLEGIARTYGLHELAADDAAQAYQRPRLERHADTMFMVFKTVSHVAHESPTTANEIVETGEIMAFLGTGFIITVRHRDHSKLGSLRAALEAAPDRLALGPAAVLHAVADHVVDDYLDATEAFERDIDEVEALVFTPRSQVGSELMYLMKREIVELRRSVTPLAAPLRVLVREDSHLIPSRVRSYFRDVEGHLEEVAERIVGFDEILSSLLGATTAKISLQQNHDVRKINSWAAIVAVPTMVAGVYGWL
ncbi:magnesium and cobalt transport protein CorA [Amycolatopsis sp. NBC_00345]|uniref:magnesium and cobalt transport protein CorA n=1 Tax=Amycolatopsis sp. NBC_00345 TaxID=2975955 RepID=UPI003FA46A3E